MWEEAFILLSLLCSPTFRMQLRTEEWQVPTSASLPGRPLLQCRDAFPPTLLQLSPCCFRDAGFLIPTDG